MSDHTPAPWRVEPIEDYQGYSHLVGAAIVCDAYMIAEVRGAVQIDGQRHETHEADAHLIAAAPELLAACKSLRLALQLFGLKFDLQLTAENSEAMRLADAAIARAEAAAPKPSDKLETP